MYHGGGASAGAIAGGVVGGVVGILTIVLVVWFTVRRRRANHSSPATPQAYTNPELDGSLGTSGLKSNDLSFEVSSSRPAELSLAGQVNEKHGMPLHEIPGIPRHEMQYCSLLIETQ